MTFEDESIELSISELANLLHTSKSALRYYEKEGLITPKRSSSSGYRRYSFLSLIELSDIMLNRNMGIPVKDVRRLLDSPVEQTELELDAVEDDLMEQLRSITQTLESISARRRRIRTYHALCQDTYHLVDKPAFERLYGFSTTSAEAMHAYLTDPDKVHYAVFFPRADQAASYVDCVTTPCEGVIPTVVWTAPDKPARWAECLLRTAYSFTYDNNLDYHVEQLRQLGHTPGAVVAEYLTFDWSEEEQRRFDYYHAWIELRS